LNYLAKVTKLGLRLPDFGRLNNVLILTCGICEYLTSHGKREVVDVIKDFEMGRLSWQT
jgi:hypothetical protein